MNDSCTANFAKVEESAKAPSTWLHEFVPPPFVPNRWFRGGHLQTLISPKERKLFPADGATYQRHRIDLADGDAMAIHDDTPPNWDPKRGSVLMIHGICGCHAAGYMVRFQHRLNAIGIRTFRLDMRGCGDSGPMCGSITHAGRSEDVLSAIDFIGDLIDDPASPIGGIGVSLGGNQWLLAAGRVGNGFHARPQAWSRVGPILAIAPPIDLQACSDAMQSPKLRFYNRYFIHNLLRRASPMLRQNPIYQNAISRPKPRTLRLFDRLITAPLGGFNSEIHYYGESSAVKVVEHINVPTMVVTSADDPLVPIESFAPLDRYRSEKTENHSLVRLMVTAAGGHHGFLQQDRTSWSDELVAAFFEPH
ncbi:YheT family hydrolase [Neorhodopirellula pilleata]|nr:alpha/beta fold hydrolase [Neorhodopirellula pilleata]